MALLDSIRRALVPYEPPTLEVVPSPPAQKAATGAGAWVLERGTPSIYAGRVDTPRFMKEAQEISHRSPWVATAERVISGKLATVPWHLEDQAGEEIDTRTGAAGDFRRLMERPNPRMTRRVLWQITSRHLGVCGNAFWFLDQRSLGSEAPLAIYYINPARMTPSSDKNGNLTGWVLDKESEYDWGTGVPLDLEEVLHFVFEPPDWGHLGHGLVEAALSKIGVQKYADRYVADIYASGGKRGGLAHAKEGILPPEVFDGLVASFRNVAESPDATKRTIVTQGAVDYAFTSATPQELSISEMLALTRDDILGIWGVPLSQTGIMSARGLNSGETVKYEEAALWQGAIHTRVVAITETVQYQLIDRIDPDWQLIIEEPAFDDQEPLFKLADLAKTQPMKNIERRELLGLDPFGDKRDEEVWLPKGFVRIYPEEPGEPEPVTPPEPTPSPGPSALDQEEAEDDSEETVRKASVSPLAAFRSKVERDNVPNLERDVAAFLSRQKADVLARIKSRVGHLIRKKDTTGLLPKNWDAELAAVILPKTTALAEATASEVRKNVPKAKKADPFEQDAIDYVRAKGGERITGINGTTREAVEAAVQEVLEEAIEDGLGPDEVADMLTDRIGGLTVWDDARADLIARTETM